MQRGYISVVEHSAAVQEVPSSNPGVPLYNCWKTRETWHRSREYTWLGAKNIVTVLKQPARVCSDIESVCSGERAYSSVVEHSAAVQEVPGLNPGVPLYNFWKTREKWHRSRENTWLGTKNIVTVLKQLARVCSDFYWICMQRGYISVVEHSAAVREVPSSNPGVPLYNFWKTREKWHRSRENTWLGTKNIVTMLKQPARVCGDVIEYACSGDTAQW